MISPKLEKKCLRVSISEFNFLAFLFFFFDDVRLHLVGPDNYGNVAVYFNKAIFLRCYYCIRKEF